jgi:hypothetical protein
LGVSFFGEAESDGNQERKRKQRAPHGPAPRVGAGVI